MRAVRSWLVATVASMSEPMPKTWHCLPSTGFQMAACGPAMARFARLRYTSKSARHYEAARGARDLPVMLMHTVRVRMVPDVGCAAAVVIFHGDWLLYLNISRRARLHGFAGVFASGF